MKQWLLGVTLLTALAVSGLATAAPDGRALSLDQYKATVSEDVLRGLDAKGMDIVSVERHGTRGKDFRVFIVARKPA